MRFGTMTVASGYSVRMALGGMAKSSSGTPFESHVARIVGRGAGPEMVKVAAKACVTPMADQNGARL